MENENGVNIGNGTEGETAAKKEEITYIAGTNPHGNLDSYTYNVGEKKGVKTKYEIYWFCPTVRLDTLSEDGTEVIKEGQTLEECLELMAIQYANNLPDAEKQPEEYDKAVMDFTNEVLRLAVMQMASRPNYSLEFNKDGSFNHAKAQALADSYKLGARSNAGGVKKAAADMKKIQELSGGMTPEQIAELIKKAQAAGIA